MNVNPRRAPAGIAGVAALAVTVASGALLGCHTVSPLMRPSPAAASSTPAPMGTPSPAASGTPGNVGLAGAERVAARAAGGRAVTAVPDEQAPTATYEVTVLLADGSDVDVAVDGRSGRVLPQARDGENPADQKRANDTADTADGGTDQSYPR